MSDQPPDEAERFSTLLQQGLTLHQAGRFDEAAALYTEVLQRFPDHPDTLDLYGVLLHQTGHNEDAAALLERAIAARPESGEFYNHLGVCRRALGALEGARQAFTAACARQPGMAEARVNLSTTLNQLGRYHEAESAALKAVELAPVNIDARLTLAAALRRLERPTEALQALLQARDIDGLDIRLYPQLAQLQTTLGQRDAARRAARRGVLINPSAKEAHVFLDEGQTAVNWARRAVSLDPGDARLWSNLASRASLSVENELGIAAARRSILLRPNVTNGYANLTTCAFRLSRFKLSINAADRGLLLDPSSDTLAVTAAFNAFALGDTARGWTLYERRTNLPAEYPRLGLPPAWDRMAPPSGPLLVCAEQGVGDEFIFLSCLPDLLRQVSDVIVECDPRNVALFERSFSGVRCVPRTVTENQAGGMVWDYRAMAAQTGPAAHIMAASLPGLYSAAITRPALPQGYLAPGPTEATAWRRWLQSLGSGPKVGLCWRSGEADAIRSEFYFTLEEVLAAIGFDTAPYVSLMYVDAIDEIADVQRATGTAIHAPPELNQRNELDRVAALISGLDIVLTVDCAVCAISAACGVPTIRLECSYLTLANGRDGLFGNVYPCRDTDQPFDRSEVLRRGAEKFQQWVGVFSERASAPTAK